MLLGGQQADPSLTGDWEQKSMVWGAPGCPLVAVTLVGQLGLKRYSLSISWVGIKLEPFKQGGQGQKWHGQDESI